MFSPSKLTPLADIFKFIHSAEFFENVPFTVIKIAVAVWIEGQSAEKRGIFKKLSSTHSNYNVYSNVRCVTNSTQYPY